MQVFCTHGRGAHIFELDARADSGQTRLLLSAGHCILQLLQLLRGLTGRRLTGGLLGNLCCSRDALSAKRLLSKLPAPQLKVTLTEPFDLQVMAQRELIAACKQRFAKLCRVCTACEEVGVNWIRRVMHASHKGQTDKQRRAADLRIQHVCDIW